MIRILTEAWPGEIVAVAVDGRDGLFAGVQDVALWRPHAPDGVGDLYAGRVAARVPAMAGAFITLGRTAQDGFLPDTDGARGLTEGARIAVRVVRAAQGGKGVRLGAVHDPADHADALAATGPGRLRAGPNPIERLAALHPATPVEAATPGLLAVLRQRLGARVVPGATGLPAPVAEIVADLDEPSITLDNGAVVRFAATPALVAIDLDTAAATLAVGRAETWNAAMLPAVARQIRLRDLAGAIVIDCAGLRAKARAALAPAFAAAFVTDPRPVRFLGFTALGLAELQRRRLGVPWHELQAGPHAAALRGLRHIARAGGGVLTAAPDVAAALAADAGARHDVADRIGQPLRVQVDPFLQSGAWRA